MYNINDAWKSLELKKKKAVQARSGDLEVYKKKVATVFLTYITCSYADDQTIAVSGLLSWCAMYMVGWVCPQDLRILRTAGECFYDPAISKPKLNTVLHYIDHQTRCDKPLILPNVSTIQVSEIYTHCVSILQCRLGPMVRSWCDHEV